MPTLADPRQPSIPALVAAFRADDRALFDYLDGLAARFDEWEPRVLAFVPEDGRFARLRREARQLVERYPQPATRPPLFGLPIGVKDIFHVTGFATQAGSRLPVELLQGPEAAAVAALRRAGALVVGKTATTEFAYFAPATTRNPRRLEHTPGGSSSGSAAAVAAGLCPVALGTQTIGSINRPAAFCGVVGFKPSRGRISTEGVIPLSPSLDHVGFFTSDAGGAAWLAAYLCGEWRDPAPPERRSVLGVPIGPYLERAEPAGRDHFEASCRRLSAAGFAVRPIAVLDDFEAIRQQHVRLMAAEVARVHAAWFSAYAPLYHPRTAELIRAGQGTTDEAIAADQASGVALRERLMSVMGAEDIDAWLSPSAPGPAPRGLDSTGDPIMNLPWTFAGLPTLTLPTDPNGDALPQALQLVGRWQEDERLFQVGQAVEAVFREAGPSQRAMARQLE